MVAATLSGNLTTSYSNTTTTGQQNLEFCPPFPSAVFETVDSSILYIVNAALNVPLAIVTTFANLLVLLSMRHVTSIHLPSKLLLCSLVLTDLGAGLVVQPQFTAFVFMKGINPYSVNCLLVKSYYITGSLFTCVSGLTMTAISLDRYAALLFHLKYKQIVTVRRVCALLTFILSYSLCFASTLLYNNILLWEAFTIGGIFICFLVNSVSNLKIYRGLRSQHGPQIQALAQVQSQQQGVNMAQYRRTASVLLWIYALFILCHLPLMMLKLTVVAFSGHSALTQCMDEFFYTIILLNSFLNPFVYCFRLPEIRTEVLKQLRKMLCRSHQEQDAIQRI